MYAVCMVHVRMYVTPYECMVHVCMYVCMYGTRMYLCMVHMVQCKALEQTVNGNVFSVNAVNWIWMLSADASILYYIPRQISLFKQKLRQWRQYWVAYKTHQCFYEEFCHTQIQLSSQSIHLNFEQFLALFVDRLPNGKLYQFVPY